MFSLGKSCVMKKSLKIRLHSAGDLKGLQEYVAQRARACSIEGTAQVDGEGNVKIVACGESDSIDQFIDDLYAGCNDLRPLLVEVEPFLIGRGIDYRGIFRIVG